MAPSRDSSRIQSTVLTSYCLGGFGFRAASAGMTLANICASSGSAASSAPKAAAGSASTAGLALIFAAMGLAFGFIMMDMMSGLAMAFAIKAMGSTFSAFSSSL